MWNAVRASAACAGVLYALLGATGTARGEGPRALLVYGGDHDFAPYEFRDESGKAVGFNVDLIRAVGREIGYDVEVKLGPWPEIRRQFEQRNGIDVTDMYYSEARAQLVDFGEPFTLVADELFVRIGANPVCTLDDLGGRTILVQDASFAEDFVRALPGDIEVITTTSEPEALRRLAAGIGDCALVNEGPARYAIRRYALTNLRAAGPPVSPRPYAFVVAKGRADLLAELDAGLARVREGGEYQRIHSRWFGPTDDVVTTSEVFRRAALVLAGLFIVAFGAIAWSWSLRRRVRAQTVILRTELEQRERAEAALATSEERFRTLVEHAPEAIAVIRVESGRFALVNENMTLLLGRDREALRSAGPVDVSAARQPVDGPIEDFWRDQLAAALTGSRPLFEWIFISAQGAELPCEVRLVRLPATEEHLVRASIVDISDRRQIDERRRLAQRMESVGRLAGGVAHDFNNLLTVMSAHTTLLQRSAVEPSALDSLGEITAAIDRGAALTRQLLAFSSNQVLVLKNVALNDVVEAMIKLLERLLGENIELELDLQRPLHPVFGDEGQLEQVLLNLAVNARDAMPNGGRLRIATRTESLGPERLSDTALPAGDYVVLTVSDDGSGMDESTRARVFEPFFTTKAPGKGTGLGLATVYGIVRSCGGNVQVTSAPGEGATFRVLIPRAYGEVARTISRERKPLSAGTGTVLLIEDQAPVLRVMRHTLETCGYRVITASNGDEALAAYRTAEGRVDLVVSDFLMPGMNGGEIAATLRAERPELPVLFVTGYTEGSFTQEDQLPAHTAVLPKPFRPEQLNDSVRELIDASAT